MILYEEVKLEQHVSYTEKCVLVCGLYQPQGETCWCGSSVVYKTVQVLLESSDFFRSFFGVVELVPEIPPPLL